MGGFLVPIFSQFGADFFHGLRRFFTVYKGRKRWKKKHLVIDDLFSRLAFHGLPPLELRPATQKSGIRFSLSGQKTILTTVSYSVRMVVDLEAPNSMLHGSGNENWWWLHRPLAFLADILQNNSLEHFHL